MSNQWVQRTVLSGASVAQNGTTSHTITFSPAAAGNFLVAIVAGAVTFTTPTGWTLLKSAANTTGLYVFTKIAAAGESSFSTTHNGSNYALEGVVYEYAAGTVAVGTATSVTGQSNSAVVTTPAMSSGLTGTYTKFSVRSINTVQNASLTGVTCNWTKPVNRDYDAYHSGAGTGTDGLALSVAYEDGATGTSWSPSSQWAATGASLSSTGEAVSFALTVVAPTTRTNYVVNPTAGVNVADWTPTAGETITRDTANAHSGTAGFKITKVSTSTTQLYPTATVAVAGQIWTASVWLKIPAGTFATFRAVSVYFYNSAFTLLASNLGTAITANSGNAGVWTRYSMTGTAPASTAYVLMVVNNLQSMNSGYAFWIDDALLELSGVMGAYFDGSTAADGTYVYAWTGTAHDSTSTATPGSGGGGPTGTVSKVRVAGVLTAVTDQVRVAGAITAATAKVRVAGVLV